MVASPVLTSIVSVKVLNLPWQSKMPVHKLQSVNLPASLMVSIKVSILRSSSYASFYTDRDASIQLQVGVGTGTVVTLRLSQISLPLQALAATSTLKWQSPTPQTTFNHFNMIQ